MEVSFESCILQAIASNFSMASFFSLALSAFLNAFLSVPFLLIGKTSRVSFLYSMAKWTFATLLILSSLLRRMERINTASRLVEQLLFNACFFFLVSPLKFGLFKLLSSFAAGIGLSRLSTAHPTQVPSLMRHLKTTLNSTQYTRSFLLYISSLLVLHFVTKVALFSIGLSYSFFVPLQLLLTTLFFSCGLLLVVCFQAIFSFFFQEKHFRVSSSGVVLLDGLSAAGNSTVQYFAIHELFCMAMFEEGKRRKIFQEIVGDVVVSREIVGSITKYFEQASRTLESEAAQSRKISDRLKSRLVKSSSADSNIFQKNPSTPFSFFKSLLELNGESVSSKPQSTRKSPPAFLKPADSAKRETANPLVSSKSENDLASLLFQSELFCSLASMYCSYKETMLLTSYKAPLEYSSLGISAFVVASFYEDVHGQVQLAIPQLLLAMERLLKALAAHEDASAYTPQPEMERTVKRSMDAIIERYRESLISLSEYPSISHLVQ